MNKWLSLVFGPGRKIAAVDKKWTSCAESERADVARSGISALNEIERTERLGPEETVWLSNLRTIFKQELERARERT